MEERSIRRAVLFGLLGALVFFVLGRVLWQVFPALKDTVFFRTEQINFDLYLIAIQFRINLFVVTGFIAGWAFCLFRRSR